MPTALHARLTSQKITPRLSGSKKNHSGAMKFIYFFDEGMRCNGGKAILGGKGFGLAQMTYLGLPVPPGFTATTEACSYYYTNGDYPKGFLEDFEKNLKKLEVA
ncbi:MAG: PEP/pyruvate-binding domain-containing protein, partial [Patescibacteria group bacterium]